jgi:hypothetical protein
MDKIVEFDRTDKSRRNPTIAEAPLADEDGAITEAVKANNKIGERVGQGKEKGQRRGHQRRCHLCRGHPEAIMEAVHILRQGRARRE